MLAIAQTCRAMKWTYQQYMDQPRELLEVMAVDAEAEGVAQRLAMEDNRGQ